MLVLALDTTTRAGSIALVRDGEVIAAVSGDATRTHAERLPGDIVRLLASQNLTADAVDVFGVGAGPGSFTGLRIGIATIQGLAFAFGRPVVAVSCLDALAQVAAEAAGQAGDGPRGLFAAWMDAQRLEVFAALYAVPSAAMRERTDDSGPRPVDGPVSEAPATVLERWRALAGAEPVWIAGDGVSRYRELLGDNFRPVEPLPPLAPVIGQMAAHEAAHGRFVAPHAVRPIYVRRSDAELARDRRDLASRREQP